MITLDNAYEIFKELTPKNSFFARELREWERGKVKDCKSSVYMKLAQ